MLSYKKAFDLAEKKGIRIYKIIKGGTVYTQLKNNGHITTRTIDRLCEALDCQPGDLVEYVPDQPPEE